MAMVIAAAIATPSSIFLRNSFLRPRFHSSISICDIFYNCSYSTYASTANSGTKSKKKKSPVIINGGGRVSASKESEGRVKRRTRSDKEFDADGIMQYGDIGSHVPVMLGEVLEVFSSSHFSHLLSFVDCTVGAAGHSSAIIRAHPKMQLYIGMDVDPVAHERARVKISNLSDDDSNSLISDLKVHMLLKNFKYIKSVLKNIDENIVNDGVDGILMDLGMSSMQVNDAERGFGILGDGPLDMRMDPQATLKAEDILNSWPDMEVGRILRDYGEESNWRTLQNKIIKARLDGGLHSTGELVNLIRGSTPRTKVGRQGWIKTATRVFQALRIAVNDELQTLEDSLYACFDSLASGGRLAVISFHSLEDRIVKQTFIDIVNSNNEPGIKEYGKQHVKVKEEEAWIKQVVEGSNGRILTKRPITPSQEEEELNRRSRSAKLRVIQKL